ncbi:hypothetical protein [Enterobacter cloacae complex sp. 339J8]|uniref:hypothetical protein n=1 Tax=Enterobacter cloacae complex sp. 339J8 TaxID=3395869 RepID=UPI003CED6AF9
MSDEVVKPGNEIGLFSNQSLSEAIKDKIFNKIYFYILVSFLLVNWQEILILFKSSEDIFYTLSIIFTREGANKQVISSQADSLIKISRIWAGFFPQQYRISLFRLFFPPFLALFPVFTEISPTDVSFGPPETGWPG